MKIQEYNAILTFTEGILMEGAGIDTAFAKALEYINDNRHALTFDERKYMYILLQSMRNAAYHTGEEIESEENGWNC